MIYSTWLYFNLISTIKKIKKPSLFLGYFRDYHKDGYRSNAGNLRNHQGNQHDKGRLIF